MNTHEPTRTRREPTPPDGPADERRGFFGRRSFELSRDPSCIVDLDWIFRAVNPAFERELGYERQELVGMRVLHVLHRDDWDRTEEEARRLAAGGAPTRHFENRYRHANGDWVWFEWAAHISPVEGLIYASGRNITARKSREVELERAAHVDSLTGLANRRGFERALDRELAAAQRHARCPGLVMVDLDRFKNVNDRYGHETGDEVLKAVADTLQSTLRASDLAARVGGDEFAVLLPDSDLDTAELVAEKIVGALRRQEVHTADGPVVVSASAGVALFSQEGIADRSDLLNAADGAMYRAKKRRSSFAVHDAPLR